ncbi:MAG: hypothetical protein Q3988_04485 [Gemella sp.]|nr:hypothetical protein [Gemella sp.]
MEKLEKLKNRYLNIEHPYWRQNDWLKKVESIFTDIHYRKDITLEEQYIFDLERCLVTPATSERYREKIKLSDDEYSELTKKRVKIVTEKTKEVVEWYNKL